MESVSLPQILIRIKCHAWVVHSHAYCHPFQFQWKCKNNFNSSSECNLQSIVSISISFGYRFYLEHTNVSWTQESMIVGRWLSVAVHSVSPYQLHVLNVCLWPMALCITHINACIFKTPSLSSCTKPNESIDFLMNVNKSFMYVYSFIHVILQLFTRLGSVHIFNAIYRMAGKRLFINSLLSCTIS